MKPLFPLLAALFLVGCGGEGGGGVAYSVAALPTNLTPGGTSVVTALVLESSVESYSFSVREGDAGGTLVQDTEGGGRTAVYTAPATAGVYHVDVRFLNGRTQEARRTATIRVTAAQ